MIIITIIIIITVYYSELRGHREGLAGGCGWYVAHAAKPTEYNKPKQIRKQQRKQTNQCKHNKRTKNGRQKKKAKEILQKLERVDGQHGERGRGADVVGAGLATHSLSL